MSEIKGDVQGEWPREMVTIPREKYEKLLGNRLVYSIGQKLCKKILDNTGLSNIQIMGYNKDVNGNPIYEVRTFGWYDGTHIKQETDTYLETEFGLSEYKPVPTFLKIVPIVD